MGTTQLHAVHVTATGLAIPHPFNLRRLSITNVGVTRFDLHDGLDATGPVLHSWSKGNSISAEDFAPDDLPFKTGVYVVVTGGTSLDLYLEGKALYGEEH